MKVADLVGSRETPTHSSYHREDCLRWARKCPGVPTWVVNGERFWGKDRVDWLVERVKASA